ncbi:AAA family ATPase [Candidatus Dojkabacteria bacterium]|uniref:AAA family ATPase n=1 Tax=Candidatus Dojkabacteria bacterium TaxID=2099670 RepID=A0A955I4P0_9BACT|nr:AAA family ATPase [Candidatus Dojkabacteria bacterium]
MELSTQQQKVLQTIQDWYHTQQRDFLTLGGYAGTGKTTLLGFFSNEIRKQKSFKIAFCSYTGKAARVLSQKLVEVNALKPGDYTGTIHRLIYAPIVDGKDEIIGWEKRERDKFPYKLIVVDEASMLNQQIWEDLLSFGVPILAVGDHGQLPPIEGKFNLMQNPELKLEEIYRQEQGNPIIKLSELARNHGEIPFGMFGRGVRKLSRRDMDTQEFLGDLFAGFNEEMMVLTGYNRTRVKLNKAIRQILEKESELPMRGDRVICLRNNHEKYIYNGMMGKITEINKDSDDSGDYYSLSILFDGDEDEYAGEASVEQFGAESTITDERRKGIDLFDFGYALTVHKAQGSQAERVVVFEERFSRMTDDEWQRWLYTAVTRASRELYIVA